MNTTKRTARMDQLQARTLKFFLSGIASELQKEIDWRAKGHGKNIFVRTGIYIAALVRDLIRIPLHHKDGIAMSRFRVKVEYLSKYAIPTLRFFQSEFALNERQNSLISDSISNLEQGTALISDGPYPTLDEWYATMEEFHQLTKFCHKAAIILHELIENTEN
jgi:hypothetical protein